MHKVNQALLRVGLGHIISCSQKLRMKEQLVIGCETEHQVAIPPKRIVQQPLHLSLLLRMPELQVSEITPVPPIIRLIIGQIVIHMVLHRTVLRKVAIHSADDPLLVVVQPPDDRPHQIGTVEHPPGQALGNIQVLWTMEGGRVARHPVELEHVEELGRDAVGLGLEFRLPVLRGGTQVPFFNQGVTLNLGRNPGTTLLYQRTRMVARNLEIRRLLADMEDASGLRDAAVVRHLILHLHQDDDEGGEGQRQPRHVHGDGQGKRRRMLVKFLYKAFIGLSCLKGRR